MKETPIEVTTIVGMMTGQPIVELAVDGVKTQLSVGQATQIGTWLVQAAESAMQETIMVRFLVDEGAFTMELAGLALTGFRTARGRIEAEAKDV